MSQAVNTALLPHSVACLDQILINTHTHPTLKTRYSSMNDQPWSIFTECS